MTEFVANSWSGECVYLWALIACVRRKCDFDDGEIGLLPPGLSGQSTPISSWAESPPWRVCYVRIQRGEKRTNKEGNLSSVRLV
mmetsp:Transcript_53935/g.135560  ORF Transcript_53935/g.135560 Transcript_53935/m.135560 type:complete len:84 (-) Transcript_53935:124-375(-)